MPVPLQESAALTILANLLSHDASGPDRHAARTDAVGAIRSPADFLAYRRKRGRWAPCDRSIAEASAQRPGFGPFGRLYLDLALAASEIVCGNPADQWKAFSTLRPSAEYDEEATQLQACLPLARAELWQAAMALAVLHQRQPGRGRASLTGSQRLAALAPGDAAPPPLWLEAESNIFLASFGTAGGALLPLRLSLYRVGEWSCPSNEPFSLVLCPSLLSALDFFSEEHPPAQAGWWTTLAHAVAHASARYSLARADVQQPALSGPYLLRWHLQQDFAKRGAAENQCFEGLMTGGSHGAAFTAGILRVLSLAQQRGKSTETVRPC